MSQIWDTCRNKFPTQTRTHTLLFRPYWLQSCWFNNAWCSGSKGESCIMAFGLWARGNTRVRVNGHTNTQSQHPCSLLFILYLTIVVSANTKTDTDSDKCLHNVRVQVHVCPLSLWKKNRKKNGGTKMKMKVICLGLSARAPILGLNTSCCLTSGNEMCIITKCGTRQSSS